MMNRHTLSLALGLVFAMGSAQAALIQTLLDEDFQGVTGITGAGTVRTVQHILTNNPSQLPSGTTYAFTNAGSGNASASSFNVRRGDNAIDNNAAPSGFGNFFADSFGPGNFNRFLVIGDNSGDLSGAPNGGTGQAGSNYSIMELTLPLASLTLPHVTYLDVAFDYVFDTNNTTNANSDDFVVELILADSSVYNFLNIGAPTPTTRGSLSTTLNWGSFSANPTALRFRLTEYAGTNSSAVGLDNIKVTAIPEPGMLGLLGLGLLALGLARRRG